MPLKVVIVGCGRAGKDLHLDAYRMLPDVNVVAVCDTDIKKAESVAREKNVSHFYPELADALEAHTVDVVSICTPPRMHLGNARQAMDAGAHVLVEKPIATTTYEADAMWSYSQTKGLKLGVVHNYKFLPGVQEAIRIVQNGAIGKVLHMEKTWLSNGAQDRMVIDKHFWCHELIGGRWAETLPHHLYIPYQFLGPMTVSAVVAKDVHKRWPWLPSDEVFAMLESDSATLAVRLSENALKKEDHMLICGTKGLLFGDYGGIAHFPVRIQPSQGLEDVVNRIRGVLSRPFRAARRVGRIITGRVRHETAPQPRPKTGHLPVIEGFVNNLLHGKPEPVPWEEAYWTMKTTEEIGRAIEVSLEEKRG